MKRLALSFIVVAVFISGALAVYDSHETNNRLAKLKQQQRHVARGVHALFVDDCSGIHYEPEVDFPSRITTPIAYVSSDDLKDPFSATGARLLFIPNHFYHNGAAFAVISRGPDGDLDSRRLPLREAHYAVLELPVGTNFTSTNSYMQTVKAEGDMWGSPYQHNVTSYIDAEGDTVENSLEPMLLLPDFDRVGDPEDEAKRYEEWFAQHGVVAYDPTNGLKSDGDCLAFY